MHQSKLIQVLRKFSIEEFNALKRFLNAPEVKLRLGLKNSLTLFKLIKNYFPDFEKSKIEKENLYKKCFPKQKYISGKIEKEMSGLFGLVQEFIVFYNAGLDRGVDDLLLLNTFYRDRGLDNLAEITIKKYRKLLKQHSSANAAFYYHSYLLEKQIGNHQARFLGPSKLSNIPRALSALDAYYVFEKLELACRIIAINRFVYPIEIGDSLVMLEHLKPLLDADFFDDPVIKLYYKAYLLLTVQESFAKQAFLDFEQLLKLYATSIPKEHLLPLNAIIRNYCVSQYVKGVPGFLEQLFYIYQDHLRKGYLYDNGKLFAATFMNLVETGLLMKQFDWVYQLIEEHKNKITRTVSPENEIRLSFANYYFHLMSYEKALDFLTQNFEDTYSKIKGKRLELMIYFEMKHVLLAPKIDAYKIYIYRLPVEKTTQKFKNANKNFIDLLKQIQLPRTFQNSKRIDKLAAKVKGFNYISEKAWLLKSLENLR